ncbi:oxaloacetate decarboxylase [Nocardioides sp. NPDC051685]|uniref:oxaloacetate decarboxylase n=1 Tax=Nocardioides sp. NPDC051685 TaxID=3364334 RepID=UPI0037899664
MSERKTTRLKRIFQSPETVIMPFGVMPMHAQMAQRAGFEAFEVSGGMSSHWRGVPDVGLLTLTEVVTQAREVARAVDIPVYCDADTGYGGGPANVRRTVREFFEAGVAGIHIEDQREPKKAGGRSGIEVVSDAEAIGRLNAAVDARDELDPDFVIVARTDGYGAGGGGLDEAIRRGQLYREETDVDVIFYEGLHTWDQIRTALEATPGPAYAIPNNAIGRRPSLDELSAMGQSIDILPFVLPAVHEVWRLLRAVKTRNSYEPMDDYLEHIKDSEGTEQYQGWGGGLFARPAYDQIRSWEEQYLPTEQQRDYVDNANALFDGGPST